MVPESSLSVATGVPMIRRWHLAVLALLGVFALACEGAGGATPSPSGSAATKKYPSSMAALGDSITVGFGSCGTYVACERNSWSTGTADAVDSHYRRILAKNPKIKGNAYNFARPGAEADALAGQASKAVETKVEYVTILIGANDACAANLTGMTSVATFRAEVDSALARLKKGLPKTAVLLASVPDLYRLWQLGRRNAQVVQVWDRLDVCPSMFAAPTSTAPADADRRRAVRDRITAYNNQLRQACRTYGKRCRWDNGRVHEAPYSLDLLNETDYFHPNASGQRELAEVTYSPRFTL
jgi:lysophospholipase L1-like esterase